MSCGGGGDTTSNGTNNGGGGSGFTTSTGQGNHHAGGGTNGTGGTGGGLIQPDGGGCVKPTCKALNAECGSVTDTKCGGVIDCGDCPSGESCGNGGPYKCGKGSPDACSPLSCADQQANCGQIGDGCTGTLSCGSCTSPKSCGGDPSKANQCGCTGVCAQIPDCTGNTTTTLSGKVLDPAGRYPLYNALVYIPNNPSDPGLQPFSAGISCDVCGATAAGDPLVTAYTAPDGTFTLQNVPVGSAIKLVIQLGRWRRQFNVDVNTSCGANSVADGTLTMPKNHHEGDIPRIAVLTGSWDAVECTLRKMGVNDAEFTVPASDGYVNFYQAAEPNTPNNPIDGNYWGRGAKIGATGTPGQNGTNGLFGTTGGQPTINKYDLVILECEGYEEDESANWPAIANYTSAGGRVFTSHFAYDWMAKTKTCTSNAQCGAGGTCNTAEGLCTSANNVTQNPSYSGEAGWHTLQSSGNSVTGHIDLVNNPKGMAFQQWLEIVGASTPGSGTVALNPVAHDSDSVIAPSQQWLYQSATWPIHFTFNAPVGAAPEQQCGRVVFSDWHANVRNTPGYGPPPKFSRDVVFPAECDANTAAMTPQEKILEFMLFDLTACVTPYQPLCTPTTCAAQNIACGAAGDGCGDLLQCGDCPSGQFCGGGGTPGQCGMQNNCTPVTCADQHIECGKAGDGCGNEIDCGNCATGQVCGLGGPGKCGSIH